MLLESLIMFSKLLKKKRKKEGRKVILEKKGVVRITLEKD